MNLYGIFWREIMIIQPVEINDAKELRDIYSPYVTDTAVSFEYNVPSLDEFKSRIARISDRYPYIKAMEGDVITGYAYAGPFKTRQAYDWSVEVTVYVRQTERRKGIGKQLYAVLENTLADMGILNMNACIAMPKEADEHLTKDSYLFHKKMGFNPVGTFHDSGFKFNTWYDMIWMEKMIGPHTQAPSSVKFGEWKKYKAVKLFIDEW